MNEIIKVMIIDDEAYFRQALKVSLPWEELGFIICGEAEDGEDALNKMGILEPDIMLIDLNMPKMNGLSFIEKIYALKIQAKIIILTGYDEFDYAKKAIDLGAKKYLLKPVDEDELKDAILLLKSEIEQEKDQRLGMDLLKKQVKDNIPILRDRLISDLMQGLSFVQEKHLMERAADLGMEIHANTYLVIVMELVDNGRENWIRDMQLWKFAVSNIAQETFGKYYRFHIYLDNHNHVCFIASPIENKLELDIYAQVSSLAEKMRLSVYKYMKFAITIGIGNVHTTLLEIAMSYTEALIALSSRLSLGIGRIILYREIAEIELTGNFYPVEHRKQLLLNMRISDTEEMNNLIHVIFNQFREKNVRTEIIQLTAMELVSTCMEFLAEHKFTFDHVFKGRFNPLEEIQRLKELNEMESWIKDNFIYAITYIQRNKSTKSAKIVIEVKNFIQQHYQDTELNIDEIARHVFTNYNHLCYLFKVETHLTINEYITEFRIKKSKEYMEQGFTSIKEIAEKVGYEDPKYYSKCFKKYYGVLPSKYMESSIH